LKYLLVIWLAFFAVQVCAQNKFIVVFLSANSGEDDWPHEKIVQLRHAHLDNILKLSREEKLLVAGTFEREGGMFIMNTASVSQARTWLARSPAIASGLFNIEVLPWTPRYGSVCITSENAEKIPLTFIRYNTHITKFNVRDSPDLFRRHDVYLREIEKTGNVLCEGVFDNDDGGIMIMTGEVDPVVITADPTVTNGIIEPIIKRIQVPEGAFCESK